MVDSGVKMTTLSEIIVEVDDMPPWMTIFHYNQVVFHVRDYFWECKPCRRLIRKTPRLQNGLTSPLLWGGSY